jgi:hypothetical protein
MPREPYGLVTFILILATFILVLLIAVGTLPS